MTKTNSKKQAIKLFFFGARIRPLFSKKIGQLMVDPLYYCYYESINNTVSVDTTYSVSLLSIQYLSIDAGYIRFFHYLVATETCKRISELIDPFLFRNMSGINFHFVSCFYNIPLEKQLNVLLDSDSMLACLKKAQL